jgi:hypothetical protein
VNSPGLILARTKGSGRLIRHLAADVRQHDTHAGLVGQAGPRHAPFPALGLDAIIVPASRPAANLDHAVSLARAACCRLVVLCSRQARSGEVEELLASRSFEQAIVIDLPSGYSHPLLSFPATHSAASDLPDACATYSTDLSMKRNIGLLLARMLGWKRIFFLDDDIRDIDPSDLRRTVSMLGHFSSAGLRAVNFPDNSVVCHAHRLTGAFQGVFVSGSVLAVDCKAPVGFFPDIYNEDWLFFYNDAASGRLASSGHNATQLRYDPFAKPQRAAWQEFGDVLAEGLYGLLHEQIVAAHATRDYWAHFLQARRSFLEAIIDRSDSAPTEIRSKMLASVESALKCSIEIQPEVCEHYIRLWQGDLRHWKQTLRELPKASSLSAALGELGLASSAEAGSAGVRQIRGDIPENMPPGPAMIPASPTLQGRWGSIAAFSHQDAITAGTNDTAPLLLPHQPDVGAGLTAGPGAGIWRRVRPGRARAAVGSPAQR